MPDRAGLLDLARRDGVFIPWQYVLADAAVSGALDCRRGYTIAKVLVERREESGVAWFLIDDLSRMSRSTIEKRAEIDREAADWIVRGAKLIALGGKSPGEVARLFNEHEVGGRRKWSDNSIRKLFARERLVGREVFRTTRQERNRKTGKVRYVKLPQDEWLVREAPHLRILSDELAAAVRTKLNLGAQSFGRAAGDRRKTAHRADLYPKVLV